MFCSNCGKEIPDGSKFCPLCGGNLTRATNISVNNQATVNGASMEVKREGKSKMAAGLLGIFLGALGIHNFYMGYKGKAIIQLLLGTVGIIVLIGPVISGIWGLVEGIMILAGKIRVDGHGVPLV